MRDVQAGPSSSPSLAQVFQIGKWLQTQSFRAIQKLAHDVPIDRATCTSCVTMCTIAAENILEGFLSLS